MMNQKNSVAHFEAVTKALGHYQCLPENWDGELSSAPQAASIALARLFLDAINTQQIAYKKAPRPSLDGDGIVGLFYHSNHNQHFLSFAFYPDQIVYLAMEPGAISKYAAMGNIDLKDGKLPEGSAEKIIRLIQEYAPEER